MWSTDRGQYDLPMRNSGSWCGFRRPRADDVAVRRVRRRARRRPDRPERRIRVRVLQARRHVRSGQPSAVSTPTAIWSNRRAVRPDDHPLDRPVAKRVETDAGPFDADIMVVALGADLDPSATPGLVEGGHEFYTVAGAFALRDVLANFGGGRVVVGVTSTAVQMPSGTERNRLLMHDLPHRARASGSSDISLVMPMGVPIPPSPPASEALLSPFSRAGYQLAPGPARAGSGPVGTRRELSDGTEMPYDLFLGVPVHRVPAVVAESGLAVDGWIPVDPLTLETAFPDVYAVGDVTSVGTPKAACSRKVRPRSSPNESAPGLRGDTASPRSTTGTGSATWRSATTKSRRSRSRS